MSMFRVAIHYGINKNGFLSYDTDTKTVNVDLPEQEWADKVLGAYENHTRKNVQKQIVDAGFDIRTTAQWLQEFYLRRYTQK